MAIEQLTLELEPVLTDAEDRVPLDYIRDIGGSVIGMVVNGEVQTADPVDFITDAEQTIDLQDFEGPLDYSHIRSVHRLEDIDRPETPSDDNRALFAPQVRGGRNTRPKVTQRQAVAYRIRKEKKHAADFVARVLENNGGHDI